MHKFVISTDTDRGYTVKGTSDAATVKTALRDILGRTKLEGTDKVHADVNVLEISEKGFERYYFRKINM